MLRSCHDGKVVVRLRKEQVSFLEEKIDRLGPVLVF
jgi:hypothetical protein